MPFTTPAMGVLAGGGAHGAPWRLLSSGFSGEHPVTSQAYRSLSDKFHKKRKTSIVLPVFRVFLFKFCAKMTRSGERALGAAIP
jgi:hypothetical protein